MTSRTLSKVLGLITGVLLMGAFAAPALAYPPGTALTLTAGNGQVVVSNGQPGCLVTVEDHGFSQTVTIDSDGMAVINVQLPNGMRLTATVSGPGCLPETAETVVVNSGGGGGGGGGGTPARTGSDTALALVAGLGALGLGGGLVVAARRKKS